MRAAIMGYKYVKGIKENPQFGKVLVVNFNPYKVCSFNCIYCGIGPTTDKICDRKLFYPPEEIFREIRDYIEQHGEPDYAWLTGFGEPTLYSGFKQLSKTIKQVYPNIKIGVYSNGSLLYRKDVREDFLNCDLMLINLNSISPTEFSKICRHHKEVNLDEIIDGIKLFKKHFKGIFGIISIFLEGINDNLKNLDGLKELLMEIEPDLYILKNYACGGYKALDGEFKKITASVFNDLPCEIVYKF